MPALATRTVVIAAAVALSTAALAAYAGVPEVYGPSQPYVERVAIAATALSLMATPTYYFVQKWLNNRDERARASGSLYLELDDALDGLDERRHGNLTAVETGSRRIYFMNRQLNHDFYDSLISSGKITFVRPELQQPIQDTFQRIKDRNRALYKLRELQESGARESAAYAHYESLEEYEEYLIKKIPRVMSGLKKEYGIPGMDKLRRLDPPDGAGAGAANPWAPRRGGRSTAEWTVDNADT